MKCKICGNDKDHKIWDAREMYFGLGTPYQYLECGECKCVQLINVPEDMSSCYPTNYLTGYLPKVLDFSQLDRTNENEYINRCLTLSNYFFLEGIINTLDCNFLDVGCGNAETVRNLASMGLRKSTGIDAFLHPYHAFDSDSCHIYQSEIYSLEEKFDIILFSHSLEHMDDHQRVLSKTRELLANHGVCIIRMPIASYAWNMYRADWFQLDAPRHLILHSFSSLELLLEQTGFRIKYFYTAGSIYQFTRSELYKKGIPHVKQTPDIFTEYFTPEQLDHFQKLTDELNNESMGDSITIVLEK